jgi:hypothetical protein
MVRIALSTARTTATVPKRDNQRRAGFFVLANSGAEAAGGSVSSCELLKTYRRTCTHEAVPAHAEPGRCNYTTLLQNCDKNAVEMDGTGTSPPQTAIYTGSNGQSWSMIAQQCYRTKGIPVRVNKNGKTGE